MISNKWHLIIPLVVVVGFSSSAYSMEWLGNPFTKMTTMEWLGNLFTKMTTVENKELQNVYLLDQHDEDRAELDIRAACLSPRLQRIINEEQHKARMSGNPWNGDIWCSEIDRLELQTIKQVLETMYHNAKESHQKFLISDLQEGGPEAIDRWSDVLKEYLFPHDEKIQLSNFKTNRLNERHQAAGYFELPLLQQIIKQEAREAIQGKRNSLLQVPNELWEYYIFPYLTEDSDLATLKSKIVSHAAKKLSYTRISMQEERTKTIAISEKNNLLAIGYENGSIQILDMQSSVPQEVTSFAATSHNTSITAMAFSADGNLLAVGFETGKIKLWKTCDWQIDATGRHSHGIINDIAFSPDGGWLVIVGAADGDIKIWSRDSESFEWQGHKRLIPGNSSNNTPLHARTAVFSPNGAYLACFLHDSDSWGQVEIWDTKSWQQITEIPVFSQQVGIYSHSITFSPDGKLLLLWKTSELDRPIRVIDVQTGKVTRNFGHDGFEFFTIRNPSYGPLAFSSDGRLLATRIEKDAMAIRDAKTWKKIFEVPTHQIAAWSSYEELAQFIKSIHFVPNQQRIVMICKDQVLLWDIESLMKLMNYFDTKLSYEEVVLLKDILHPEDGGVHILTEYEQKILNGFGDNDAQMKAMIHDGLSSYFQQSSCVIQ